MQEEEEEEFSIKVMVGEF